MLIVAIAVLKVLLITVFGWVLTRKNYIGRNSFDFLNKFLVDITSTCMLFAAIVENREMVLAHNVAKFIIFSVLLFILGLVLARIFYSPRRGSWAEFAGLLSFQNCGYLPLNIALFLLPPLVCRQFQVYVFLYLLGFNILMWSIGSYLMFKKGEEKFELKSLLLPPVSGTVAALLVVYFGWDRFIPAVVLDPIKMVGDMTFVLSAIVLGGWLARVDLSGAAERMWPIILASLLRLLVMPAIFFFLVVHWRIYSLLGLFVVLVSAMPSAISLPVVVNLKGGDTDFASQGVFVTHLISIITIPVWLGLFLKVSNFTF